MNLSSNIAAVVPAFSWLLGYRRSDLLADGIAGTIVAIMLVPQAMAYALLAGLPAEVGLYASVVPLLLYALFGSSRTLAVGPVAIVSLLVAGAIAEHSTLNPLVVAATLAGISGAMLVIAGIVRLGFLVNFISHPVIAGFSSGAALLIAMSQLKSLLGIEVPSGSFWTQIHSSLGSLSDAHSPTVMLSLTVAAVLFAWPRLFNGDSPAQRALGKSGPLVVVFASTVASMLLKLESAGVDIVGQIPRGLPPLSISRLDLNLTWQLLEISAVIALVGYAESVAVAKSLATRRRQRINPNQELIGLGFANLGSSVSGGYPVTGGLSRSVVNFNAGAKTPFASVVTALLVLFVSIALTPLLYHLPKATLAVIIVIAVATLVDIKSLRETWIYNKGDSAAMILTLFAVLLVGVEAGLLLGIGVSLMLHIYRTSRPHVAIVGRVPGTEHFRNVDRHAVETIPGILTIRIDESLYFSNTRFLEEVLILAVAERPQLKHVVMVCNAVNDIDTSALETLGSLIDELQQAGVTLHLAEVKGPVMDRLERVSFTRRLKPGRIFQSTHDAMSALATDDQNLAAG